MSRLYIGILLLVFLLVAGIVVSLLMPRYHLPVAEKLYLAAELCARGKTEAATVAFAQAQMLWEKHRSFTSSVCDHEPQDDIDALLAMAAYRARTGQWEEFGACCARLAVMTEDMSKLHGLSFSQIL